MRSKSDHKAAAPFFPHGWPVLTMLAVLLQCGGFLGAVGISWPAYSWLSWFALIPLFTSIAILKPVEACFAGALWGASLAGFSALLGSETVSLQSYGAVILLAAVSIYAAVGAKVTRRVGFNPLILGLGWLAMEVVLDFSSPNSRGGLFTSVPTEQGLLGWIGQSLGYLFVAFIVAIANGLLLALLGGIRSPFPARQRRSYVIERESSICEILNFVFLIVCITSARPRAPP